MGWTPQQQEAIEYRGKNILLAAAAGSGKTAVLVQRIIELITKDKVSVNELLVLTFTDAAAGEMREKIKKAILKALRENPENQHLQKQRLLIHSANISTVHSFCLNLLKSNIHMTDLPVDFTLAGELENKIMIKEALNRVLERYYRNIDRDLAFADLVMGHGGIKNDNDLRDTVTKLHEFSRSMPYPAKWLNEAVRPYKETARTGEFTASLWQNALKDFVEKSRDELFEIYRQILKDIDNNLDADHPYKAYYENEAEKFNRAFSHMDTADYTSVRDAVYSISYDTIRGKTRPEPEVKMVQERITALRDLGKKIMEELKAVCSADIDTVITRIKNTSPVVRTLKNIVFMLDRCYTKMKREKSLLDFNDLEHQALNLLVDSRGNATEVADKVREKYKYILVDEYQDTNNVQDLIFSTVSRDNSNIFMVGDLKQSIYKFRNAVPKLFSDKYKLYDEDDEKGHLIRLFKNFRSRHSVVDTVNFVFSRIMSPEVGNIRYTEEEYLVQGALPYNEHTDTGFCSTEFHLISRDMKDGRRYNDEERYELEARVIAERIKHIINSGMQVFDKETEAMRPVQYRDIVILMRKTKDVAPVFERIFEESGIPVYSDVGHSYLGSLEIQTVLAFLQIIDNPRQDIPLIAVMRSPMWGFTPAQLAHMRSECRTGSFYDVVLHAKDMGDRKADEFITALNRLRYSAENSGVDKLIYSIYYDFGYFAYVGSLSSGKERQANLRVLLERATEFEHTKMSGLFSFMNYIDTMITEEKDMTPAKIFGEGEDVVRLMSIHKSKGLEFPVVALACAANQFNLKDASKTIVWDEKAGLGIEYVDTHMRVRYPSLPRTLVGMKLKQDMISEEMRLLYVALTRAREKLIITATYRGNESVFKKIVRRADGSIPEAYVRSRNNYREWLTSAFLSHPGAVNLRNFCDIPESTADWSSSFDLKTFVYEFADDVPEISSTSANTEEQAVEDFYGVEEQVSERLSYIYPNQELCRLPVKLSVSEVKRMQAEDGEYVPLIEPLRSSKMLELSEMSGAERGTIVHFVMQWLSPDEINSAEDVKACIAKMVTENIITKAQSEAVDCVKIAGFFASEIGQRMKKAARCEREFSFYTRESADEIYGDGSAGDILLQGTIDCFFIEENGKVVLLDYKTDKATTRQAAEITAKKYDVQMKYYRRALANILGREPDECYLYFMDCGEFIPTEK